MLVSGLSGSLTISLKMQEVVPWADDGETKESCDLLKQEQEPKGREDRSDEFVSLLNGWKVSQGALVIGWLRRKSEATQLIYYLREGRTQLFDHREATHRNLDALCGQLF
jgi:hypothetical protein